MLESLEDWFGIPEAREEYITKSVNQLFWCAYDDDKIIGYVNKIMIENEEQRK